MPIRMKTTVTLKADANCPSHSLAEVAVRDLVFPIDEPNERGGTNTGPTPTEAALGALIGCTNVIGNKCAASLGIDIGNLTISGNCSFDRRGVTLAEEIEVPFRTIMLMIKASGPATQHELERVAEETEKYCPLSKLFKNAGTEVTTTWEAANTPVDA